MQPIPFLLLAYFFGAGWAVFCPVGTGDEAGVAENTLAYGMAFLTDSVF